MLLWQIKEIYFKIIQRIKEISLYDSYNPMWDALDVYRDEGFGFALMYPKTWYQQYYVHKNGMVFRNPNNHWVRIIGYGEEFEKKHALKGRSTERPYFKRYMASESRKPDFNCLEHTLSGVRTTSNGIEYRRMELITEHSRSKQTIRTMQEVFERFGNGVVLRCEAPINVFDVYEELFLDVLTRLELL